MNDTLLHPDDALKLALADLPSAKTEDVALADALGRVMPVAPRSRVDQPPFDKSAMDGFAYGPSGNKADTDPWRVVETVAAGAAPARVLGPGECARIMTGAPIPKGASGVQRVEWTRSAGTAPDGAELVAFDKPEKISNIIKRGENQRAGDPLFGPRVLGPQEIGILASSGYARVEVSARPVVGVLSTGDELAAPGVTLGAAGIYDSNGPMLTAQVGAAGCVARAYGIVRDDEAALRQALSRALDECDVVLVSGGVSMGDYDHVPAALRAAGVERVFHKLAMKPGKPTYFGRRGDTAVFGLPGNPVSVFVNFELFVKPQLYARMGLRHETRQVRARLSSDFKRREADRVEFLPARLETAPDGLIVAPLRYHGSSMLAVLADADCLLRVEIGADFIPQGTFVDARLLRP